LLRLLLLLLLLLNWWWCFDRLLRVCLCFLSHLCYLL
jgi:hypothetical protein